MTGYENVLSWERRERFAKPWRSEYHVIHTESDIRNRDQLNLSPLVAIFHPLRLYLD